MDTPFITTLFIVFIAVMAFTWEGKMKDYRVVMLSLEPDSDYWFVIWRKAFNKYDLIREVNQEYSGRFEVDEYSLEEVKA